MFHDRFEAGRKLAEKLKRYRNAENTVILAVPRGALEIGYELSKALGLPLDIVVAKKIGAPLNPEYAIGAVDPDGGIHLNKQEIEAYGITAEFIEKEKARLREEIQRKYIDYRGKVEQDLKGKTVILTDDGIATGFTMKAAIDYLKKKEVKKIVLAVPAAAPDSVKKLEPEVDEVVTLEKPVFFAAVGQFYEVFNQISDEEAKRYLNMANQPEV